MLSVNILKSVKERARKIREKLTDRQVLESSEMRDYLTNLAKTITKQWDRSTNVTLDYSSEPTVACTNDDMIYINANNNLVAFFGDLKGKVMCMLGILCHELAHRLFFDFKEMTKITNIRCSGKWYPQEPESVNEEFLTEINEEMKDEKVCQIISSIASQLDNIMADVHDEAKISEKFQGLVANSIYYPQVAMYEQAKCFEDLVKDNTGLPFILGLLLYQARFNDIKIYSDEHWENEYVQLVVQSIDWLDMGKETDDLKVRHEAINQIIVLIWPYIKEEIEKIKEEEKEAESSPGAGEGAGEEREASALEKLIKELEESGKEAKSSAPKGKTKTVEKMSKEKKEEKAGKAGKEEKKAPRLPEAIGSVEEEISKKIADEAAVAEAEAKRTAALNAEISAVDASGHSSVAINVKRKVKISASMKEEYNSIAKKLLPISKAMQRQVKQALKDQREGGKNYGEYYGKRFEEKSISRLDGRYFSKQKLPTKAPRLAVAVLVDESGSMSGQRERVAMDTAVLLEDFTRGLEIPTLICGHSTGGSGNKEEFELYSYVEFDKIDQKDRFRLSEIRARRNNRDGLALKIMCERLAKREEEFKILIVISDGQPAGYNYGGPSAEKEMQEVCRKYRKKGLAIFAAAIGSDKDNIHRIYKDGYLDISDLNKLPKQMVNLVKKHIR